MERKTLDSCESQSSRRKKEIVIHKFHSPKKREKFLFETHARIRVSLPIKSSMFQERKVEVK